jgi:DNA-binding NarL/FixJ family response regulator
MEGTVSRKSVSKQRLVLIEDYKLIRIGIRMVLDSDHGLEVVGEGENAAEGMRLIDQLKPDVAIVDLGLPDLDGFELTRQLRKKYPDLKILILTSHETEEEVMQALAAGAHAYCLKDIMSDSLLEAVKTVCEDCVWLDPQIATRALRVFSEKANSMTATNSIALDVREREVLRLLVEGMSNSQITRALELSIQSTKSLVMGIVQKLSAQDRIEAATMALQRSFA